MYYYFLLLFYPSDYSQSTCSFFYCYLSDWNSIYSEIILSYFIFHLIFYLIFSFKFSSSNKFLIIYFKSILFVLFYLKPIPIELELMSINLFLYYLIEELRSFIVNNEFYIERLFFLYFLYFLKCIYFLQHLWIFLTFSFI